LAGRLAQQSRSDEGKEKEKRKEKKHRSEKWTPGSSDDLEPRRPQACLDGCHENWQLCFCVLHNDNDNPLALSQLIRTLGRRTPNHK
jgi:hypothetical protein